MQQQQQFVEYSRLLGFCPILQASAALPPCRPAALPPSLCTIASHLLPLHARAVCPLCTSLAALAACPSRSSSCSSKLQLQALPCHRLHAGSRQRRHINRPGSDWRIYPWLRCLDSAAQGGRLIAKVEMTAVVASCGSCPGPELVSISAPWGKLGVVVLRVPKYSHGVGTNLSRFIGAIIACM